jgi:26S proteasome regulatory subunit N9
VAAAPALAASAAPMKEKITLLALMELAARRPALGRVLTFDDVAAATHLPPDQVEWLLMRALALGLIDGDMDEVARTVNVTYVKPRVLDAQQIKALADGVRVWRAKADAMCAFVEAGTKEIIFKA